MGAPGGAAARYSIASEVRRDPGGRADSCTMDVPILVHGAKMVRHLVFRTTMVFDGCIPQDEGASIGAYMLARNLLTFRVPFGDDSARVVM